MSLPEVTQGGDRVKTLEALRDVIAESIVAADPDKRASLASRLMEVLAQIAELAPQEKAGDPLDEISARRAARGGATARPRRTAAD